jgi:hypothetical protein
MNGKLNKKHSLNGQLNGSDNMKLLKGGDQVRVDITKAPTHKVQRRDPMDNIGTVMYVNNDGSVLVTWESGITFPYEPDWLILQTEG